MRIKGPGSRSEIEAHQILRRALADSGWTCGANVSVQQILEKEERLTRAEFDLYSRGAFDFVVYDDASWPRLALEVDGFGHAQPVQIARDLIKNDLCRRAELRLLRVGSEHLAEPEQTSILEWLVSALVRSEGDPDESLAEDDPTDEGEPLDLTPDDGSDEDDDDFVLGEPGIEADHPFPDNDLVTARLRERHAIGTGHVGRDIVVLPEGARYVLDLAGPGWPQPMQTRTSGVAVFVVSERSFRIASVESPRRAVFEGIGHAEFAWANRLPAGHGGAGALAPIDFPWDAFGVASELAAFDALRRAERWADSALLRK